MIVKPNSVYNKIYKHQSCRCFYCNTEVELSIMEREHVFPHSKGGRGIANKVLSCKFCNRIKKNLTIEEFKINVELLINSTDDIDFISRYKKILKTLNRLLDGKEIRNGWHKKAIYKSVDINKTLIRNEQN